jgi:hypothetical protein
VGRQADALTAALQREVETACKALVLQIDRNLRATTPVLTGHARASWIPSVGSPSSDEPAGDDGSAHEAGVASVLSYRLDLGDLYVSNNAPYIQILNLGTSTQAPAGFIEAAIDAAQTTINAKYESSGIRIDATSGISAQGAANLAEAYSPLGGDA